MPQPERVFLDWSVPTAAAAARWLSERARRTLAIVPTREAGRRLRRAAGSAVEVLTPPEFLEPDAPDTAGSLTSALALADILAGPFAARCRSLFPAGVPTRTFAERLALARQLRSLQAELAGHGYTAGDAAERFASRGSPETPRWRDLSRLFETADAALARAGFRERESARLSALRNPALPTGVEEIAVVAVADLPPLVALALECLSIPVSVLIPGPPEATAYDAWGRPLASVWNDRDPGWSDFDAQVRLAASPEDISADFGNGLEIGLLDRELLPALREGAAAAGRTIHDPLGEPLAAHWLPRTLSAFGDPLAEPAFEQATALLQNGAVRAWLASRPEGIDLEEALADADRIRVRHFPSTLRSARPWLRPASSLHKIFVILEALLADLRADPLAASGRLAAELSAAFAPHLPAGETELLATAAKAVDETLASLRSSASLHDGLSAADWLHTFRDALGSTRLYPPCIGESTEALGWLELPWNESPRLLLAGMNLGRVPGAPGFELFLNETARSVLGMPGATERRARDAYFLARILALPGRVEAIVLKSDAGGSPLDPSPLLFAGAGDALPARVERLFADAPPAEPDPAWSAGWLLDPPVVEMPRTISVTDFQRYLDCPFTFHLARVVKMEVFDPSADELDAAQFGDLLHHALEFWAEDGAACESTDPAAISRALDAGIEEWVAKNLGRILPLPLRLQVGSARARLAAFAEWQARDRRDGWRIHAIEKSFDEILGVPWTLGGWEIRGRIDRVDRNDRDGRWRVIDYKTFDSADGPQRKHLRAFRAPDRSWPPDYARVGDTGQWWTNLQLPLYRQLLIESGRSGASILCGYFNLPKTIAGTGLQTWDTLDDALQAGAMACTKGVLADLARRRFWPPNSRAAYAEFAGFFPPDAGRVIDPDGAFVRSCAP